MENKSLSKIQSSDSIWSRDSEEEKVAQVMPSQDVNNSLENILLDTAEVSSLSSREEISINSQMFEDDSQTNLNNNSTVLQSGEEGKSINEKRNALKDVGESDLKAENDKSFVIDPESFEVDNTSNQKIPAEQLEKILKIELKTQEKELEKCRQEERSISEDGTEHWTVKSLSRPEGVVDVNFLEDRGEMPNSISSKSLLKFFNDSPASKLATKNIDEEGKNFFDSFTASQKDELLNDVNNESNNNTIDSKEDAELTPPTRQHHLSDLAKLNEAMTNLIQPAPFAAPSTQLSCNSPQTPVIHQSTPTTNIRTNTIKSTAPSIPSSLPAKQTSSIPSNHNPNPLPFTSTTPLIPTISPTNATTCPNLPDHCYDAWIPPHETTTTLSALNISPNMPVSIEHLTLPGIIIDQSLGDPIMELMMKHLVLEECSVRKVSNGHDVPQNLDGLLTLINQGNLRSAVDLTGRLIGGCGQGVGKVNHPSTHSPFSIQLWFCRFSLLHHLSLHSSAQPEWHSFHNLDSPDLYYQYNQAKHAGRKGSMVPFEMRVLQAEHERYMGRQETCLEELYVILGVVNKIQGHLSSGLFEDGEGEGGGRKMSQEERKQCCELWKRREVRVLYCVADCLLQMKDYYNCLKVYRRLQRKQPQHKQLLSNYIARIYLQAGDIERAEKEFSMTSQHLNEVNYLGQAVMNRALVEMARGRYNEAYVDLKRLVEQDKTNITALNNLCVCTLYTGRLKEALRNLELIVYTNPQLYLKEILILNLCTLYELESSKAIVKKKNLLRLVGQHKNNAFNPICLKLT